MTPKLFGNHSLQILHLTSACFMSETIEWTNIVYSEMFKNCCCFNHKKSYNCFLEIFLICSQKREIGLHSNIYLSLIDYLLTFSIYCMSTVTSIHYCCMTWPRYAVQLNGHTKTVLTKYKDLHSWTGM